MEELKIASGAVNPGGSQAKLAGAFLMLLRRMPLSRITITCLCREAQVSRKTFYKYYSSIEDLVDKIYDGFAMVYLHYMGNLPGNPGPYERYLRVFTFWFHYREYVELMVRSGLWSEKRMVSFERHSWVDLTDWTGTPLEDPQKRNYLYQFAGAGYLRLVESWCLRGFRESPEELARIVAYILTGEFYEALQK